jgi:hypothetical protein
MISFLRDLIMPDDSLPPADKTVLAFFEIVAFALGWGGVERLLAGKSFVSVVPIFAATILTSYTGFKWPQIKLKVGNRLGVRRYRAILAVAALLLLTTYDIYDRHVNGWLVLAPWWHYGPILLGVVAVIWLVLPEDSEIQRLTDAIAQAKLEAAEQIARANKQNESDLYRSHQASDQLRAEAREAEERLDEIRATLPKPSQYPIPPLRLKVLEMVSALQGFLGEHGDEPAVTRLTGESTADTALRYFKEGDPWKTKFIGDYRLRFGDSIPKLRDEMRVRVSVSDTELNEAMEVAANNEEDSCKAVKNIVDRLWTLGQNVNA